MTFADFTQRYPFQREREVEFGEIDMYGHVNNVRYAGWAETIRTAYFGEIFQREFAGPVGVLIARHELNYVAPVGYPGRVVLGGRIVRWGTKSFDFESGVWSIASGTRAFHSLATIVTYDHAAATTIPIPELWRARAEAFEAALAPQPASGTSTARPTSRP